MDYPTHTLIRNLVLTSLIGQYRENLNQSFVSSVVLGECATPKEGTKDGNLLIKMIVESLMLTLTALSTIRLATPKIL